jgi:hypothetical protein
MNVPADRPVVGMFRVGGAPIGLWLDGGNDRLLIRAEDLARQESQHRAAASRLAEEIGRDVIPRNEITVTERRRLLEMRRRLHRAEGLALNDWAWLEATLRQARVEPTRRRSRALAEDEVRLVAARVALARAMEREEVRLWNRVQAHLRRWRLQTGQDADQGVVSKRPQGRQFRQRSELLWRELERATTSSTPRGWYAHAGLAEMLPPAADHPHLTLEPVVAVATLENVHLSAARPLPIGDGFDGSTRLAAAPLRWVDGDTLVCWVVDRDDPTRMVEITVRRSQLLDALLSAIGTSSQDLDALTAASIDAAIDQPTLRGFLDYLVAKGILVATRPPAGGIKGWFRPNEHNDPASSGGGEAGSFVDVYRRANASVSVDQVSSIETGVYSALRILSAMANDAVGPSDRFKDIGIERVSVLEWIRSRPDTPTEHQHGLPDRTWPVPARPGSPYQALVNYVLEASSSGDPVQLSGAVLDALGLPRPIMPWPIDALVRLPTPGAEYVAVFDQITAAAVLDARFVGTLEVLHGPLAHVATYRAMLAAIERKLDLRFVEMLIPPLSDRAANAVRRIPYVGAWTGDPDPRVYFGHDFDSIAHIPLDAITVRRVDGRLVAEASGRRLWPIYHATRSPLPPWNAIADLLLATAPISLRWAHRRLGQPLALAPDRAFMPRILVDGSLVLSGAQWRLRPGDLWDPHGEPIGRLAQLSQLRQDLGLPRVVFVAGKDGHSPVACDLTSLRAVRRLSKALEQATEVVLVEMLPSQDELWARDREYPRAVALVSELLVRLPIGTPPDVLADRVVALLQQRDRSPPSTVGHESSTVSKEAEGAWPR